MTTVNTSLTKINFLSQAQYASVESPVDTELWAVEYTPKGFDLFDVKFTDHIINDVRWLRSDTYGWHYGTYVDENYGGYKIAYNHLVDDIEGKQLETETIGGYTVTFYRADDGHKICPENQVNILTNIYDITGIAWYYVLDVDNERFKLPRSKYNFVGYREEAGKYIEPGLPNITGTVKAEGDYAFGLYSETTGVFNRVDGPEDSWRVTTTQDSKNKKCNFDFDASRSNSIYGNNTTVQPAATEMYLYFYVGEYTEAAIEQAAGISTELLNDKMDRDLSNLASGSADIVIQWQVPTAENSYTWYRKYKSGWVEQGGISNASSTGIAVSLPITMLDNNYTVVVGNGTNATNDDYTAHCGARSRTTTSFSFYVKGYGGSGTSYNCCWHVSGMAAIE